MIAKIKKNDTVKVIAGVDAGKTGKVVSVNPDKNTATVEGVRVLKKHRKARNAQETSRIEEILGPVDMSNLMVVCPTCGKAVRTGVSIVEVDGKKTKVRVCKKCGAVIEKAAEKPAKKAAKKSVKAEAAEGEEKKAPTKKAPAKRAPKKAKPAEETEA